MALKLGKYSFTGPFKSIDKLRNIPGVYAVICKTGTEYFVIDIGECSRMRTTIAKKCKKDCWVENCDGQLMFFVHFTILLNKEGRRILENEVRELFYPACKIDIGDIDGI